MNTFLLTSTAPGIPARTLDALHMYECKGIPTGGFLYAVLTNDLFAAVEAADTDNIKALKAICEYVYNQLPAGAWGSPEKVKAWLNRTRAAADSTLTLV